MATKTKKKTTRKRVVQTGESDSAYMLKLVMYLIIGSLWLKINTGNNSELPIPIGFVVGLFFAMHDHFQIDRKIEYALLLVAMFIGFWLPIGIFISL